MWHSKILALGGSTKYKIDSQVFTVKTEVLKAFIIQTQLQVPKRAKMSELYYQER